MADGKYRAAPENQHGACGRQRRGADSRELALNFDNRGVFVGIVELEISVQYDPGPVLLPELDHRIWNSAAKALGMGRRNGSSALWNTEILDDRSKPNLIAFATPPVRRQIHRAAPCKSSTLASSSQRPQLARSAVQSKAATTSRLAPFTIGHFRGWRKMVGSLFPSEADEERPDCFKAKGTRNG